MVSGTGRWSTSCSTARPLAADEVHFFETGSGIRLDIFIMCHVMYSYTCDLVDNIYSFKIISNYFMICWI